MIFAMRGAIVARSYCNKVTLIFDRAANCLEKIVFESLYKYFLYVIEF